MCGRGVLNPWAPSTLSAMTFDPEQLPIPDLGLCCLACGYGLAGLPRHRCPECGRAVVIDEHIPRGDFPIVIFDGQELVNTPETVELLRRYRIPYQQIRGVIESTIGLGVAMSARCKIGVIRECYFETIDLLRRQALGQPMPAAPPLEQADWKCPGCGEENPGTFECCWNCGEAAPDGPSA